MDLDADNAGFLADFGVPVTFAGAPAGTLGILDDYDEIVLDEDGRAGVSVPTKALLVESSVAALLTESVAVTVGGLTYRERSKPRHVDGAFATVYLRRV